MILIGHFGFVIEFTSVFNVEFIVVAKFEFMDVCCMDGVKSCKGGNIISVDVDNWAKDRIFTFSIMYLLYHLYNYITYIIL